MRLVLSIYEISILSAGPFIRSVVLIGLFYRELISNVEVGLSMIVTGMLL